MPQYHIAVNGQPAKCTAATRACPRGEHFGSLAAADTYLAHNPEQALDKTDYEALYQRDPQMRAWRKKTAAWDAEARATQPKYTSDQVLQAIPKGDRLQVTAEQLDAVYGIMREFGTQPDDSWGFRKHIATASIHGHEWSERGAGYRYNQRVDSNGRIYDVWLSDISDYEENPAKRYAGQARIRRALGLPGYSEREKAYIATEYYNGHNLALLGDIPEDGAQMLRDAYVAEIVRQPRLIDEVVADWQANPAERIGNLETYIRLAVEETGDQRSMLAAIARKNAPALKRVIESMHRYRTPVAQRSALAARAKRLGRVWAEERALTKA